MAVRNLGFASGSLPPCRVVNAGLFPERSEVTLIPTTHVAIIDKDQALKFMKMVDLLEDLDDVQAVYSNADIAGEILDSL